VLTQRLMAAAIGLPILAAVIASPEPIFAAAIEAILAVAAFELVRSAQMEDGELTVPIGAAAATAVLVALTRTGVGPSIWALLVLTALALALLIRGRTTLGDSLTGWWIGAVLYLGVLGGHFVLLRGLDEGQRWLLVMLAAVFATDTGAYAIGRLFGRHKIAPRISPKKTWEGAVGGYAFGAVAGVAVPLLLLDEAPATAIVVLIAAGVPIAAISGDLVESALKRRLGVEDVSNLLPGHGGFLDRLDSLLFAGPWIYWSVRWLN
jgi:phosphatidate cytidylyltransferase